MDKNSIFKRWQSITGCDPENNFVGFFQVFRPNGKQLSDALVGMAGAEQILPRLLDVYKATESGYDRADAYFIVKAPQPLTRMAAENIARSHLEMFAVIAEIIGDNELLNILDPLPSIQTEQGKPSRPPQSEGPEILIYEAATEFVASLNSISSPIQFLNEAMYQIACDSFVRDYILWPLYQHSCRLLEPFGPYFQLWQHGANVRFLRDNLVTVFVPELV